MRPGMFITFEGIEGCGKTTQMRLVETWLRQRGVPCVSTREPGGTDFGRALRSVLLDPGGADRTPMPELLLYLADRVQNLEQVVGPATRAGQWVLCDRYHDATLAYQGHGRGIPLEDIHALAKILKIRTPDRTVLFDLDVVTSLRRARARNRSDQSLEAESRFEQEAVDFHERVRVGYLALAGAAPERFSVIDASGNEAEVHKRVVSVLSSYVD